MSAPPTIPLWRVAVRSPGGQTDYYSGAPGQAKISGAFTKRPTAAQIERCVKASPRGSKAVAMYRAGWNYPQAGQVPTEVGWYVVDGEDAAPFIVEIGDDGDISEPPSRRSGRGLEWGHDWPDNWLWLPIPESGEYVDLRETGTEEES